MSGRWIIIVLVLIYAHLLFLSYSNASNGGKNRKFEAFLKYAQECKDPNPPYAKKITILYKYQVKNVNNIPYLSGNTTIMAPIQFRNFSGRTFQVDSGGKRIMKFQISQVSCRNVFAKAILMFSNLSFTTKNCILKKGFSRFEMDMNKIVHALPVWHESGDFIHELRMVRDGATEFCNEIAISITK